MPIPLQFGESVLAIDPGNFQTAYCWLNHARRIEAFGKIDNPGMRDFLISAVAKTKGFAPPTLVACEQVASYGMSVGASVFETCNFIGRLQEICEGYVPFTLVVRLEVKLAICHSPRANDSAIRTALIELFGAPGTAKAPGPTRGITKDIWAALALAETVRSGDYRAYVPVHEREKA
jgi:hypothetical protein